MCDGATPERLRRNGGAVGRHLEVLDREAVGDGGARAQDAPGDVRLCPDPGARTDDRRAHDGACARRQPLRGRRCPRRRRRRRSALRRRWSSARRATRRARRRRSARSTAPRRSRRRRRRRGGRRCACRYFSGVPRSIQYASATNPNTGWPASITVGEDLPLDRDLAIGGPLREHRRVDQVRARVHVAGDQVLGLLTEGPHPAVRVGLDEAERAGVVDVVQGDRDRRRRAPRGTRASRSGRGRCRCRRSARRTARRRRTVERVHDGAAGAERLTLGHPRDLRARRAEPR